MSIGSKFETHPLVRSLTTLALAVAAPGCGAEASGAADEPVALSGSVGIPWETFLSSVGRAPNGALVVESDMAFPDEEAVHEYWKAHRAPGRGEELTVKTRVVGGVVVDDVWAIPQNVSLTYCIGTGFNSTQMTALLPALDAATRAWAATAGVRFLRITPTGTCNASNNGVVFDIQRVAGSDFNAVSFFPSFLRSARTLFIYDIAFTTTAGGRTLTGILTHELGHSLGFRHEHIWLGCTPEQPTEARQVTSYDEMSVMHYPECRDPEGGGYALQPLDVQGSVSLYGLSASLIVGASG